MKQLPKIYPYPKQWYQEEPGITFKSLLLGHSSTFVNDSLFLGEMTDGEKVS